jgi:hypothetical protein
MSNGDNIVKEQSDKPKRIEKQEYCASKRVFIQV